MRIVIIGGHGKVALLLAPKLVAAGHDVVSLVRNRDHEAQVAATGATPVEADLEALDTASLAKVFRRADAVVWSAGAGGGSPKRTYAVDRDAAIRSMDAASDARVSRYVMVSYLGAGTPDQPHGVDIDSSFHPYAEAKTAADDHLRGTTLGWTILKPSVLTLAPSTGRLDPDPHGSGGTSRELVADVITAVLAAPAAEVAGTELAFTDGEVPVAEAVAALGQGHGPTGPGH